MKKNLFLFLSVFTLLIISCGKKDTVPEVVTPTNPIVEKPIITFSKNFIVADGFEESIITVKDVNGNDISANCFITANGTALSNTTFSTEQSGIYSIVAKLGTVSSLAVALNATAPTQRHTRKVLAEDYTGAWCGYCPRVGKSLEDLKTANPNLIPVAIHNGDALAFSLESQMRSKYGVSGFPTAIINRNFAWNEVNSQITNELNKWAPVGLAIESTVAGTSVNGKVKTQFNVSSTKIPVVIAIMLIEDGKVLAQTSYYNTTVGSPFFGLGNPITNYVQNQVLRNASTNIFGDAIPQTAVVKDNIHETTFSFNAAGFTIANCKIVAAVSYADGQARTGLLNAQVVQAGQTKNFD